MQAGRGQPGGLLSRLAEDRAARRGDRAARPGAAVGAGASPLRLPPDRRAAQARGPCCQPQAAGQDDARRQPAVPAQGCVPAGHYRLRSSLAGVAEPGPAHDADGREPAMGGRHHLRPSGRGVRLSGGRSGRVQPQGGRLGAGRSYDGEPGSGRAGDGLA